MATIICYAQEHLTFMDIPIAGTLEQFANKLANEKGLAIEDRNDYEDEHFKIETKMLKGLKRVHCPSLQAYVST